MAKRTEQREAIRAVFEDAGRPLNAQEVLEMAQLDVPGLGIATVYRYVKNLLAENWLRPVELPGEPSRYELSGMRHHHHFMCEACSRVFDVPGCPGSIDELTPQGFETRRHEVLLYGRCADCAEA